MPVSPSSYLFPRPRGGELEKWSSYIIPPSAGKGARGVKFLPLPPAPRGKIEMGVPLQHTTKE